MRDELVAQLESQGAAVLTPEEAETFLSAAVDPATNRIRVPYAFASDNWADTGNAAVFRHDNGADPYEQNTQQSPGSGISTV